MKLICKSCNTRIPESNVNVQEGICFCSECAEAFKIADFLTEESVIQRLEKPAYSKVESYFDQESMGFIIPPQGFKGSTIFFLIFTLFWNAISWFMFAMALRSGELFPTLFLTIFITIGAGTAGLFLYLLKGSFSLILDRNECHAVWSLYKFSHTKRIDAASISDIIEDVVYTKNYQPVYGVCIKHSGKKSLKFGSAMSEDERRWCIGELRAFLDQAGLRA